jgi:hypothetical protein
MTTEPMPATRAPSDLVRPIHALLVTELGLQSPLAKGVAMLDRAASLSFGRTVGVQGARVARQAVARAVALGEAPFDETTIRAYDEGHLWLSDASSIPPSVGLADAVMIEAQRSAGGELMQHASGIFDVLAAEARLVVGILEALPEPPRNLFSAGDPASTLTRAPNHSETYSALLNANARFWAVTGGADLLRDAAGHGVNRFPDGAPRLAFTYRNWKLAMEKANSDLRSVHKHFRLWFTVVDGWEPGVWKPEDIKTSAADRSFSAKLKNFGAAVGIPSGKPA